MLADKGYNSDDVRASLLLKGIVPVIPHKANGKQAITCDFRAYKERNRVERMFNKLKQFQRIATRYDKTAVSFMAFGSGRGREGVAERSDLKSICGPARSSRCASFSLILLGNTAEKRVPNISEYNRLVPKDEQLPYIFVIHDEMADWMADWMASSDEYRKVIQQKVTRLAAKARACGIHVIMITQRAAQEAIPPGIRDNLNNRLVLKVAGEAGSVLALGVKGAERLLGKGHLAARLGGDKPAGEEYFVAQVPFASTEELQRYANAILLRS